MDIKTTVEETNEVERRIVIEIPAKIYDEKFSKSLSQVADRAQIKGFRPGRAPRALVLKLYGDKIGNDVLGELIGSAYRDVVKERELKVIGDPEIAVDRVGDAQDLKVTANVALLPEPKIENYLGISAEVLIDEVHEIDRTKVYEGLRERHHKLEPTSKTKAEKGDVVTFDCAGTIDGKKFEGSDQSDVVVEIGANRLPGVIDQGLIGMEIGGSREVELPASAEEIDGEDSKPEEVAKYTLTLKKIERKILPELTDEFVKETGIAENLADLQKKVEERLEREVESQNRMAREAGVFQAIGTKNEFKIPQRMIDEEMRQIFFERGMLDASKQDAYRVDMTPFRDRLGEAATERVRKAIIMKQIIEQEKIEVSQAELDEWLDARAKELNCAREKVKEVYRLEDSLSTLRRSLAIKKVTDLLLEKAKLKEKKRDRKGESES